MDIILTENLKSLKTKTVKVHGKNFPLLAKADLIKMKKKAGRPQDLEDIKALEALSEES